MKLDNITLVAFQRAAAKRAITQMDGWTAVPEFVAAVGECDRQIHFCCRSQGVTDTEFYAAWINYLKAKPL